MLLTPELFAIIFTVAVTLIGAGFTLWKRMESRIKESKEENEQDIHKLEIKVEALQKTVATRQELHDAVQKNDRAIESFGLAMREMSATMTQRIDMVLFELGRQQHGKKD